MPEDFDAIWSRIQRMLTPGIAIRNWSIAKSCTGGSFRIIAMTTETVTVFGGRMRAERTIPKAEFGKLAAVWDRYRAGRLPRSDLGSLSQNTTYVLSLLHAAQETTP